MAVRKKTRNPFSDMQGDLVRAVNAEHVQRKAKVPDREPSDAEHNAKFKVMEFKPELSTRVEVYLLPPFASFRGFGGSGSGLMVGKTPSLIVRTINSGWGSRDVEYDLASQPAWESICAGFKAHVMREYYQN